MVMIRKVQRGGESEIINSYEKYCPTKLKKYVGIHDSKDERNQNKNIYIRRKIISSC